MARHDLIGETLLNQFRVENYIASGGMATIYRVWDLQRSVPLAMKVLHPELADDPAFMARFEREARSLQTLVHPHIVPFYGLYQAGDLTFLLERYIDGPSLDEVLRQRGGAPLPLVEALIYFKALYTSLGYAHAQGIIHCDIKPGNVLIDQGGHVYLTDFGIARFVDSTTTTSSTMGTPMYMAPEQIRGERVTPQTDQYALGVLMFELTTGRRPFRGDGDVPAGIGPNPSDRVRYQQLFVHPLNPQLINPGMTDGVAQVIMRSLAKKPADRYVSVQAMAADLSRVVAARFDTLPDRVKTTGSVLFGSSPDQAVVEDERGAWPGGRVIPPEYQEPISPPGVEAAAPPNSDEWVWGQSSSDYAAGGQIFPSGPVRTLIEPPPPLPEANDEFVEPLGRTNRWGYLAGLLGALVLLFLCGMVGARMARGLPLPGLNLPLPQVSITAPAVGGIEPTPAGTSTPDPQVTSSPEPTETQPTDTPEPSETPSGLTVFPVSGEIAVILRQGTTEWLYLLRATSGEDSPGDLRALPAVPNVNQVGVSAPQWSPDGTHLVWTAEYDGRFHVVVMDMQELEPYQLLAGEAYRSVSSPAWLPDGKRVSFWAADNTRNSLVIADATTGEPLDQVPLPGYRNLFVWNWQNSLLAFVQQSGGAYQTLLSDAANTTDRILNVQGEAYAPAWSNDGEWIAFQTDAGRNTSENEIWVARADGSELHPITTSPPGTWSRAPTWSPDGTMIAFVSNRSGSLTADFGELFVVEVATGKTRQMTNTDGRIYDWRPTWRP